MPDNSVSIRFLRLPGTEDLPLPCYQTEGSSGLDVCAANREDIVLEPGSFAMIKTGLKAAVPLGYEIQVRPRSGLAAKHGIGVVNGPGTVDSDYRGEICVILINFGKVSFTVTRGMRIAQFVIQKVERANIAKCSDESELGETVRGEGGFGHTGIL
ncbi:dUTP diphosphatase [bacterium]|nr:dUTP diphosphatase [bacterium]